RLAQPSATTPASLHVREKPRQLQDPKLAVSVDRRGVYAPRERLYARAQHPEEPLVGLMRRRELSHELDESLKGRDLIRVACRIEVRPDDLRALDRDEFARLLLEEG